MSGRNMASARTWSSPSGRFAPVGASGGYAPGPAGAGIMASALNVGALAPHGPLPVPKPPAMDGIPVPQPRPGADAMGPLLAPLLGLHPDPQAEALLDARPDLGFNNADEAKRYIGGLTGEAYQRVMGESPALRQSRTPGRRSDSALPPMNIPGPAGRGFQSVPPEEPGAAGRPVDRGPPQLSVRAQDPAAIAALPLQQRHVPLTHFGLPAQPLMGMVPPRPAAAAGGAPTAADPMANLAASIERERQHAANQNFAGVEAEQGYRRAVQEGEQLRMALDQHRMAQDQAGRQTLEDAEKLRLATAQREMAEEAGLMGPLPRAMTGGIESGMTTPDAVRREEEFERQMAGLSQLIPHWREHIPRAVEGGDPIRALASLLGHGHRDVFADPMSPQAGMLRGVMRHEYGQPAMENAGAPPFLGMGGNPDAWQRALLLGQHMPSPPPNPAVSVPPRPSLPQRLNRALWNAHRRLNP